MVKNNLPNIPLYIGDWEKDCNVLSLEAEAAWLRIIFKMFTNGKQSTYKIPTKGLQNLWRCSSEKVEEIIQELIDFDICKIEIEDRFVQFTSRRYEKENKISDIRREAVSSRKDRTKSLQSTYKKDTKHIQNNENENENENDIVSNNENNIVSDNENDLEFLEEIFSKKKRRSRIFVKPTIEEIEEYCKERGNSVNPVVFFNHYEAKGWKIGKNSMKNWKAAIITWEANGNGNTSKPVLQNKDQSQLEAYLEARKQREQLNT